MTTSAREELARMLGQQASAAASSAQLRAKSGDLRLEVEGIGQVRLPVPADQAAQLCRLGRPAKYGRGEETLTDPRVRNTWEIPKGLVRIKWGDAFGAVLEAVGDALGLPPESQLTADFHSMLVYEPGQFFVAHQDSEKDDAMIATLVVMLPSAHSGGELVVHHGDAATAYRGSKSAISLVAFYPDCLHEVRPVKSGHRITLTYNLLLDGRPVGRAGYDDATVTGVTRNLEEHFTTRIASRYRDMEGDPPSRLVYLLDHEYTARGLSWSRLKGADASRAALLRAAADSAGCDVVLALADIQETWDAYESGSEYGNWLWQEDDAVEDGSGEYELNDLIESSIRLTRWMDPEGAWAEDISLVVDDADVCATTSTEHLRPYESQHEGYMGNYGNTLDRWYRRGAVVVWPRDRSFTNRAEASPAWALDELLARARTDDAVHLRAAVATLAPFWDSSVRAQNQTRFLAKAQRVAVALDDQETAGALLRPFSVESLRRVHMAPLARLAGRYGEQWVGELLRTWFGERPFYGYAGGQDRAQWLTSLPGLSEALHAQGNPGRAVAHRILALAWDSIATAIQLSLAAKQPTHRQRQLGELGKPLAALLAAAAATEAVDLRDKVVDYFRQQDGVTACVLPALRTAATFPADLRRDGGFIDLASDCAARLRARLSRPARDDDDWSIGLPDGCTCDLCGTLSSFLQDPVRRSFDWPLAEQRRRHIHSRIDMGELPVRHQTRRTGRPFTLVLTKTPQLFERERQVRVQQQADLDWLTAVWHQPN